MDVVERTPGRHLLCVCSVGCVLAQAMILKEAMPCIWGPRNNGEPGGEQTLLLAATHVLLRPHPQVLHALLHTLAALEEILRKRYVLSSVGALRSRGRAWPSARPCRLICPHRRDMYGDGGIQTAPQTSALSRLRIGVADFGTYWEAPDHKEVSHEQEVRCASVG